MSPQRFAEYLEYESINWKKYQSKKKSSGVINYSLGADFIWIEFPGNNIYLYNDNVTGSAHVRQMKKLADAGENLSSYKNEHRDVHENYAVHYKLVEGKYKKIKENYP